jgi:hypothetical protein
VIFHFDFGKWATMVRLAWTEPDPRTRRHCLRVVLVSVPLVAAFHAVCFFLDGLLFPGLWRTEVRNPVFVVGHAGLAHRDPGVPNWLDATGHPEGYMSPRWTYSATPPTDEWPTITARKVRFDEIRSHLPAGVRAVSKAERIRVRQQHVQRRYRSF